jgi:GntR family transcriptional regulator/MocR family aminotransferase
MEVWRRLSARALRAFSRRLSVRESSHGRPALREAIAKHVSFARAVACSADDITVTAGSQQAFDLLARILVTPNRTVVAVENPGYPPIRATLAAAGAKVVPVPVDEEGLIVERLPANARVVCVTPSHQFPLGVVLSAKRRAALLEFAHTRGAVIIEDDYDAEFRFGDRPLDALQTLDRSESVFYVGTFSKSLFPALRLGFIVAPPWAQRPLGAVKRYTDRHCAVVEQDTLAAFIHEGHLARHVRKMRTVYGARRKALLHGLHKDFSPWLAPLPASAGLHLAALATRGLDVESLVERAEQSGVGVRSLRRFEVGRAGKPGIVFGYGTLDERGIAEGLARLRRLLGPMKNRARGS